MRIKRFFIISIIFVLSLIFMNLLVLAENNQKVASHFQSNGNLIKGWYWLRDANLRHYAQWTFQNIPAGSEDLVLNITALATDRPSGGRGFKAKFKLIYGFPGSGDMGGVFETKTVILPNVSAPNDPSGYTCQGQISIDRAFISGASTILVRVERESAGDNHIAFKEDSVTILAEAGEEGLGEEELEEEEEEEEQLPETNTLEGATLIQPGNYTGSLGESDQEGHRDNDDYYQINLDKGQLITLQLAIPGNANFGITLLNPRSYSRGSSITQGNVKTLDYVADSSGTWYIRINRSSGEGEYQLSIDIEDQDDAGSGQDAGDSYQEAIPISSGTWEGLLKAGDNDDY
ncbi:MAG: PPC domain-containing protein [Candidatus Atribacteria bacterium]|nr:PPC domain-containing protein [Candidatus Atribacteria bacterium]